MKHLLYIALTAAVLTGCKCSKLTPPAPPTNPSDPSTVTTSKRQEPQARVYRMNGPYAHNVMVIVSDDGLSLEWYPQINEVDASSAPIALVNGYYLDSQGVTQNSRYLTWTYEEYANLPVTPSREEIMAAIIPDSHVMEIAEIPLGKIFAKTHPAVADSILEHRYNEVKPIFLLVR